MRHGARLILAALWWIPAPPAHAAPEPAPVTPSLRDEAVSTLRQVLREQHRWVKVHAAESLLAMQYPQGVQDVFLTELQRAGNEPEYRIGIWRVLAAASAEGPQRDAWITRIRAALMDPKGQDTETTRPKRSAS